jgi:hypothetical protein
MALANYTDLQAAIASWNFARTDLPVTDLITLAETRLNGDLRVRQMIGRATATISDEYSTVPTDMSSVISFVVGDYQLTQVQDVALDPTSTTTAEPMFFAIVGDEFRFYPAPDTSYTSTLTYWQRIPALSGSNVTNWVLTDYPDAYLFACNLEAALWMQDRALAETYEARYQAAIAAIKSANAVALRTNLRIDEAVIPPRFNINVGY